jgi:hypothetical protein
MRITQSFFFFIIGHPTKVDPLLLPDQSLEGKYVEGAMLENEMGRKAGWTHKLRQGELNE